MKRVNDKNMLTSLEYILFESFCIPQHVIWLLVITSFKNNLLFYANTCKFYALKIFILYQNMRDFGEDEII